jgi:hypothetical protein
MKKIVIDRISRGLMIIGGAACVTLLAVICLILGN